MSKSNDQKETSKIPNSLMLNHVDSLKLIRSYSDSNPPLNNDINTLTFFPRINSTEHIRDNSEDDESFSSDNASYSLGLDIDLSS